MRYSMIPNKHAAKLLDARFTPAAPTPDRT